MFAQVGHGCIRACHSIKQPASKQPTSASHPSQPPSASHQGWLHSPSPCRTSTKQQSPAHRRALWLSIFLLRHRSYGGQLAPPNSVGSTFTITTPFAVAPTRISCPLG